MAGVSGFTSSSANLKRVLAGDFLGSRFSSPPAANRLFFNTFSSSTKHFITYNSHTDIIMWHYWQWHIILNSVYKNKAQLQMNVADRLWNNWQMTILQWFVVCLKSEGGDRREHNPTTRGWRVFLQWISRSLLIFHLNTCQQKTSFKFKEILFNLDFKTVTHQVYVTYKLRTNVTDFELKSLNLHNLQTCY